MLKKYIFVHVANNSILVFFLFIDLNTTENRTKKNVKMHYKPIKINRFDLINNKFINIAI